MDERNLQDELQQLGNHLVAALRIARNGPNRHNYPGEFAKGLAGLARTLESGAGSGGTSAAAQRMELEGQYLQGSHSASAGDTRFEAELSSAIRAANASLKELVDRWAGDQDHSRGGMPSPAQRQEGHQEVHPDDVSSPPRDTGHEEVHPDDVESGNRTVDLGK